MVKRDPHQERNQLGLRDPTTIRLLPAMPGFYEFFCGGGMARAGLGPEWRCLFANDIDARKGAAYVANWGSEELRVADVASLSVGELPGQADLAWASFPCQDLSLAGVGAGLDGARSGAFWAFCLTIRALVGIDARHV